VINQDPDGTDDANTQLDNELRLTAQHEAETSARLRQELRLRQTSGGTNPTRSPSLGFPDPPTGESGRQHADLDDGHRLRPDTIHKLLQFVTIAVGDVHLLDQNTQVVQTGKFGMTVYDFEGHDVAIWIERDLTVRVFDSMPNSERQAEICIACSHICQDGYNFLPRVQLHSPMTQKNEFDCGVYAVATLYCKAVDVHPEYNVEAGIWRQMLKCLLDDLTLPEERDMNALLRGEPVDATADSGSSRNLIQGMTGKLTAAKAEVVPLGDIMTAISTRHNQPLNEAFHLTSSAKDTLQQAHEVFERLEDWAWTRFSDIKDDDERRVACESFMRFRRLRLSVNKHLQGVKGGKDRLKFWLTEAPEDEQGR
jgi:hypothetical protein